MRFIQLLRRSQPRLLRTFTPSVLKWNPSVSTHTFQGRRLVSNNTTISGPRCSDMTSADLLKELSKKNDQDGIIVGFSYPLEESAIGKREEGNIVVRISTLREALKKYDQENRFLVEYCDFESDQDSSLPTVTVYNLSDMDSDFDAFLKHATEKQLPMKEEYDWKMFGPKNKLMSETTNTKQPL